MLSMRSIYLFCCLCLLSSSLSVAQVLNPIKWQFSLKEENEKLFFVAKVTLDDKWHLYGRKIDGDGPIPTTFTFKNSADILWQSPMQDIPKPVEVFDKTFGIKVSWFDKKVTFQRPFLLNGAVNTLQGEVEYMVCDDKRCLPPSIIEFDLSFAAIDVKKYQGDKEIIIQQPSTSQSKGTLSLLTILISGFIGGLAALLMPCIFPMLPLTISFFTKSKEGGKPIVKALIYGLSIILIYVVLGLLITIIFGSSALNQWASSMTFNLIFFVLILVFAISFLGAFEINLPYKWQNAIHKKSNKGGLIGIFFMAFALVLVSFSCTGPIIGNLLVLAVSSGSLLGPAMGMLGFSIALALPFTLFAIFPSWLQSLPKSGSWLNKVKVTFGFLELAFALKFLSNVDLAYHWNLLNRDVFLMLWVAIFFLLSLYLLNVFKMPGDKNLSDKPKESTVSIPQLFFAIVSTTFFFYLLPGLWGAPLKAISGWLPPLYTQDFTLGQHDGGGTKTFIDSNKKYVHLFQAPHGINAYYDYKEGLAMAIKENKPLFIDFTGHSCVNCRKMEASVWSDPGVLSLLKNDLVVVSLYVDDRTELAPEEQYVSSFSKKKIRTIGNKWSDFQAANFGANSQPYYLILDHQGKVLLPPFAFEMNIKKYTDFLKKGIELFETQNKE